MSVRSGQSIVVEFTTASFSTGAATNADSLPTGTLVLNGVDNAATVTVTNVDTGRYKAAVTLPTLAIGDVVELSVAATVSTVAGKAIVWRDTKDILLDASGDVTFNNTSLATVTTVTNQLTAAQIATGVWQDATAGDFTAASSIGKSLYTTGNAPGAASGLALVGSNVGTATSVSGAVGSVTGNVGGNVVGSVGSVTGAVGSVTGNVGGSVVGDVQGKVLGGGASAISGVGVNANVTQSAGTTIHNSDGTLASATATTVTFPTTDAANNSIPDDARFAYTVLQIYSGGTAGQAGQVVLLTTKNGVRTFNILSGTCPVALDNTCQYIVLGSWQAHVNDLASGAITAAAIAAAALNGKGDWATAGAQMDLVNAPNVTAITAIQNGLSKPGTAQTIDLTPTVPTTGNVANSIADCLNAARAQGFGKWAISGTTLTLYAPDGTTVVRTFTLDSSTAPTSRT